MRSSWRSYVLIAALLTIPVGVQAATITSLFATGVDNAGNPLTPAGTNGLTDPHWLVTTTPGSGHIPAVTFKHPAYFDTETFSRWISINANGGSGGIVYQFRTTFTLPANFNPAVTSITVSCATDDAMNGAFLNGALLAGDCDGFGGFQVFGITSGFVAGTNTIDFLVQDNGPPGAFRAQFTSNTDVLQNGPAPVPEPATLALLGFGAAMFARRRK